MTDLRSFIRSLPNAADLDPVKRAAAEREIEQRVRGLSAADRASFETTLREMASEQHRTASFETKWTAARAAQQLKEQLSRSK